MFLERSRGRQQQARTRSNRVAVLGVVTTFSFSLAQRGAACAGRRGHQRPLKALSSMHPHSRPAEPQAGAEQWGAKRKVTCTKPRPAPCPASHLAPTLGTCLPLPRAPRAAKAAPKSMPPALASSRLQPREPGGFRRGSGRPPATHLRRTGLGPTRGEATGTGAGAPQKRAAPPPPYPCRLWEKFPAAWQRAAGGIAAQSTTGGGGPRPGGARRRLCLLRGRPTTSGAPASSASPAGRRGSSPCSAEAAPVRQELLCSGRDGGGAAGDVAPRAPGASEECGLGRAAAASPGEPRAARPRPAPPLFPLPRGTGGKGVPAPLVARCRDESLRCASLVRRVARAQRTSRGVPGLRPHGGGPPARLAVGKGGARQPLRGQPPALQTPCPYSCHKE